MRTDFRQQLESLQADLGAMCALAGDAVGRATRGLLEVDAETAREVAHDIERLRFLHNTVERRTLGILARQAPVAGDLRRVVTAIHVAADADRMGDSPRTSPRSACSVIRHRRYRGSCTAGSTKWARRQWVSPSAAATS